VRITRIPTRQVRRGRIKVDEGVVVEIEHDGEETRVLYGNQVISRASGNWIEYCFVVKEYKVCIAREDLEVIVGGS